MTFRNRYHWSLMVVRFHPGLRDDDGSTAQPFRTMQQTTYASKRADGLEQPGRIPLLTETIEHMIY